MVRTRSKASMKAINHRGFLDQEIIDTARSKLIDRVDG